MEKKLTSHLLPTWTSHFLSGTRLPTLTSKRIGLDHMFPPGNPCVGCMRSGNTLKLCARREGSNLSASESPTDDPIPHF